MLNNGINAVVLGFIQTIRDKDTFLNKPVYNIDTIPDDYDFIIVANSYTEEIYKLCEEKRLNLEKIIFLFKYNSRVGCTDNKKIEDILQDINFADYCQEFGLTELSFVFKDAKKYSELNSRESFSIKNQNMWPILSDKYAFAGSMNNYFWQDLWAAKLVIASGKKAHFDIGSRLDGFIAHLLASQIEVTMIDIRQFPGEISNLYTIIDDATNLGQVEDNSIESLSALCSLEHFGLGRYGDPVDPEACFKCFTAIQKKMKKDGNLYISLPIGKERVEFNAHRVFYASTISNAFSELNLIEFSCTADGKLESNVDLHKYDEDNHNGEYRYGLFHFIKK